MNPRAPIVLLTHPGFSGLVSQERYASLLADGLRRRGLSVQVRRPDAWLRRWLSRGAAGRWAGYVDQYLIFPFALRKSMQLDPPATLYVVCDQALGPWVPLVAVRPHVVHCHDFVALRSALGLTPQHALGWTGRLHQRYIRAGLCAARHFVCVSQATREDLHALCSVRALDSEVVPNALAPAFRPLDPERARARLSAAGLAWPMPAPLLFVGGDAWYKNREGVLNLYAAHVDDSLHRGQAPRELWMVTPPLRGAAARARDALPPAARVRLLQGLDDETLAAAYASAALLLFPSLHEGFGWPVAEALACGCAVLTTRQAPMTEVGGARAQYLPPMPAGESAAPGAWARDGARRIAALLADEVTNPASRARAAAEMLQRHDLERMIDACLAVYRRAADRAPASARLAAAG